MSLQNLSYRLIVDRKDVSEAEKENQRNGRKKKKKTGGDSIDFGQIKRARDILKELNVKHRESAEHIEQKESLNLYTHSGPRIFFSYIWNIFENFFWGIWIVLRIIWRQRWFALTAFCSLVLVLGIYETLTAHFIGFPSIWWANVPQGYKGILFDKFQGKIVKVLDGGDTFKWPWQSIYQLNVIPASRAINNVVVYSRELERVDMNVRVNFSFKSDQVREAFYRTGGRPVPVLWEEFIEPKAKDVLKTVVIKYSMSELVSEQDKMKENMIKQLNEFFKIYLMEVTDLQFESIRLPSKAQKTEQTLEMKKMRLFEKALEKWDGKGAEDFVESLRKVFK